MSEEGSPDETESLLNSASLPPSFPHQNRSTTWTSRLSSILIGQLLSILLCLSGVTSVYLGTSYNVHLSMGQNFLFYVILSLIFTSYLALKGELAEVLRLRGWRYFLLALADAEANFLVVKAYQYTTLTSVQLLDCFTIPTVLVLSRFLLGTRYRWIHLFGVGISLVGVAALIWADVASGIPFGVEKERLLGDVLCLSGAFLYGVSNVAQEFLVKTFEIKEFLGMIGLFGAVITSIQTGALESDGLSRVTLSESWGAILGLLLAYAFIQLLFYILTANLMQMNGATVYNLSILTADFYSLLVGIFLFHYPFQTLYFISFAFVIIGILTFSVKDTQTRPMANYNQPVI